MMNKVLIITYYWPPAGGPGVQRWLKFVKYLPEFGIEPIVYVPENGHYPIQDQALTEQVPKGVKVLRRPIIEPYSLASLFTRKSVSKISSGIIPPKKKQNFIEKALLWIRGNIFIPDARVLWVWPSYFYLRRYIKTNNINTVITSGPPHSLHLIGMRLQKFNDVKWIADFRDPWTTIGYHKELRLSGYAARKHKELEQRVLTEADSLIVTSKSTKEEFRRVTSKPIAVITNGYDIEPGMRSTLSKKFRISHIGSLLSERNPEFLWKVLAEMAEEDGQFRNDLELQLVGNVSSEVLSSIERAGIKEKCEVVPYVEHSKAVKLQREAQVLLLVEIDSADTRCIIPGKLFEYLASGRPILAVGPQGSDIKPILAETNAGSYFTYSDKEKVRKILQHFYELYKDGELYTEVNSVEKYSRRTLTGELAKLLKKQWES